MKRRDGRKALRLSRNPKTRDRVLDEFNQSTLEDVGPMGGEQGMKVLSEMNSLVDDHEEFVKSLVKRVDEVPTAGQSINQSGSIAREIADISQHPSRCDRSD